MTWPKNKKNNIFIYWQSWFCVTFLYYFPFIFHWISTQVSQRNYFSETFTLTTQFYSFIFREQIFFNENLKQFSLTLQIACNLAYNKNRNEPDLKQQRKTMDWFSYAIAAKRKRLNWFISLYVYMRLGLNYINVKNHFS